jgi:hypothetical protein
LRKLLMSSLSALGLQQRLAGDLLVHRVGGASQTQLTSAWYAERTSGTADMQESNRRGL